MEFQARTTLTPDNSSATSSACTALTGEENGKSTLIKILGQELKELALEYSWMIAESFFLQNVKGTYQDFESYLVRAHSGLLALLKSRTLDPGDPNLLLRALYNGRVPENSPFKPPTCRSIVRNNNYCSGKKEIQIVASTTASTPFVASTLHGQQQLQLHSLRISSSISNRNKQSEEIHSKTTEYSEQLKYEASVVQRVSKLQKDGMWYDGRLPRNREPPRIKVHWDYVLEEMIWLATDFAAERKWKRSAAKMCSKMIDKCFSDRAIEGLRAKKEEEIRVRKIASFIAREIKNFWSNAQQIVEYKEQSRIEEIRKKALDQQLSYIVDQTEKYSSMLAESFVDEASFVGKANASLNEEVLSSHHLENPSDGEFEPTMESEDDDEETIAREEEENEEHENELSDLERHGQMSLDDLLDDLPHGYLGELMSALDDHSGSVSAGSHNSSLEARIPGTLVKTTKLSEKLLEAQQPTTQNRSEVTKSQAVDEAVDVETWELESDVDDSESVTAQEGPDSTESEASDLISEEEDGPEDEEQTLGLASLLQSFAPDRTGEAHDDNDDDALNSVAAMAESFQPMGYNLSSQKVNTKSPPLLHHTLREYQLIGLDWLVKMYEKKLNGILADEMGLGKTIQTIALLAHLAVENGNWGPHLIVVPTSVMLNWEMEFKKWCPGLKILTYYGSIKERRVKRTGWTRPNAFHVCITSYKLVIQDHGSFRRKRWKYLILDEAQNIKNFKSQRWQLLLNFSTQRRLLLTGTPLQNNLMELWSLMHFLMPNVFQSHSEFREWFSNPVSGMVEGNSEYNENIIRRLHKVLRPFILRRLKSEVEKQLPKKHEHVVMCRLSKRQRFLYEDFMSRTKTKETLAKGNLLSVINVLMQLRKVCNHPNLFESRPVTSPLQSEGITYLIPSIVFNLYGDLVKSSVHPLFEMTKSDLLYTKLQAERMLYLKPPGEDPISPAADPETTAKSNVNKGALRRRHPEEDEDITEYDYIIETRVVGTRPDGSITCTSKRKQFLKWRADDVALPAPKAKVSMLPFFLMDVDSVPSLENTSFVEAVSPATARPRLLKPNNSQQICQNTRKVLDKATFRDIYIGGGNSAEAEVDDTEEQDREQNNSDEEDNGLEISDTEASEINSDEREGPLKKNRKRKKLPLPRESKRLRRAFPKKANRDGVGDAENNKDFVDYSTEVDDTASEDYNLDKRNKVSCGFRRSTDGSQWADAMGYNPAEFQEADVQARSIRNRRALIERLKFVNDERCNISPLFGFDALDQCRVLGTLPVMRYYGTRCRHLKAPFRGISVRRNYATKGYFLQGYEEVYSISQLKTTPDTRVRHHPLLIWRHTRALTSMVRSLEEALEAMDPILKRFILYVPAVSAPLLTSRIFHPSPSLRARQFIWEEELREVLMQPTSILHPIVSAMRTQFPDPRLIQYDCGKLQVLDTLLRHLKSENHRVLIFTQMAKMLDVLESFLTHHGYIYLRLDGSTRIDQRQILMEKFNSDKRIFCFILSTRSGGIGVNLTGADTVIFYDSDWNPTMDAQAQDRCHRIGQTRDVHIYRLVSEKTIEENILKKSNQKRLLGELAIEGGNFTTAYFQKHSIFELFDVHSNENDEEKRSADKPQQEELKIQEVQREEAASHNDLHLQVDKSQMSIFESALAAAEDEADVQATRTVRAETAAELAEFDERIPFKDLGEGQEVVGKCLIDTEMDSIMAEVNNVACVCTTDQKGALHTSFVLQGPASNMFSSSLLLSKVEIYALKFMESTMDDWSRETVAQAQKELDQQKREWEQEHIRQLEDARSNCGGETTTSDEEELLTYSSTDAQNQVWISQGRGEEFMPLWAPPTPPSDDSDMFVDSCHGFLYDYEVIPEARLPAVYYRPKKNKTPKIIAHNLRVPVKNKSTSTLVPTTQTSAPPREKENVAAFTSATIDVTAVLSASVQIERMSSKVTRKDERISAPRSFFARPTPTITGFQKYKNVSRPMEASHLNKQSLGPGAVTFPIAATAKAPPAQHQSVEWMIAEDHALLQTVRGVLEMPLSLLVVNPAQTPNWDLAAEIVNLTSKIYRSPKQCQIRYETVVGPREEGKIFYEEPSATLSCANKEKKGSKSFIKVGPPSPSGTGRIVKMSQLSKADNNSQLLNTYVGKFDLAQALARKRLTSNPMTLVPHVKTNKQAETIFTEHGINWNSPVSATVIAQRHNQRLQLERKKLYYAAKLAAAGSTQTSPHPVTNSAFSATAALAADEIQLNTSASIPIITVPVTMAPVCTTSPVVGASVPGVSPCNRLVPGTSVPGTSGNATATGSVSTAKTEAVAAAAQAAGSGCLPCHPPGILPDVMIQKKVSIGVVSSTSPSTIPIIIAKRQNLSQQQSQIQAQPLILHQHQLNQKQQENSLGLPPVTQQEGQTGASGVGTGSQLVQLPSTQLVTNPSSALKSTGAAQIQGEQKHVAPGPSPLVSVTSITQGVSQESQVVTSMSGPQVQLHQKQVVLPHHQETSAAQKQQLAIGLSQTSQASTSSSGVPVSSVLMNQPTVPQQLTAPLKIQGQKEQFVMTKLGQVRVGAQQQQQHQSQQPSASAVQQQGHKQVAMAYQAGSMGQGLSSQGQLVQIKPAANPVQQQAHSQQQYPTKLLDVHLGPIQGSPRVVTGQQTQAVVPPPGLGQALFSGVSSVSSATTASLAPGPSLLTTAPSSAMTVSSSGTTPLTATAPSVTASRGQQVPTSPATQQRQGTIMQLVKQHTVGGKTVTRTLSNAEVAAFLKQHGMATLPTLISMAGQPPGTQGAQIGQITSIQRQQVPQVQVPTAHIITSAQLQNLGYPMTPTSARGAQMATVLKTPVSQQPSGAGTTSLTFPRSFSQFRSLTPKVGAQDLSEHPIHSTSQPQLLLQQLLLQQRRQQVAQQQQETAPKLANVSQVSSQGTAPQLIAQAAQKHLQTAQHIQHVLKPGHGIRGQGGILRAQLVTQTPGSRVGTSLAPGAATGNMTTTAVGLNPVTVSSPLGISPSTVAVSTSGQAGIIRAGQQNQGPAFGSVQVSSTGIRSHTVPIPLQSTPGVSASSSTLPLSVSVTVATTEAQTLVPKPGTRRTRRK